MQPNNMVNQPVRPVVRAQSAGPTFDNGPSIVKEKGSKKTGWIFGIVLCLILAAGGIGFGVWAWMDGKTQVDDLNGKISTLKQQNDELQNQLNNEDGNDDEVDTAGYIYVGEWGLKFKIPGNLMDVSYRVHSWDETNYAGTGLCVSGATTGHGDAVPSFLNPSNNNYDNYLRVCINRNTRSTSEENGGFLYEVIPAEEFYIVGPQAVIGDGTDTDWEVESANAIRSMFEDETNRSAI